MPSRYGGCESPGITAYRLRSGNPSGPCSIEGRHGSTTRQQASRAGARRSRRHNVAVDSTPTKQRRRHYRANIIDRYQSVFAQLRRDIADALPTAEVDYFGLAMAHYTADAGRTPGRGPTWREAFIHSGLGAHLATLPAPAPDLTAQATRDWDQVILDAAMVVCCRRGRVNWTSEPYSLRTGSRYASKKRARSPGDAAPAAPAAPTSAPSSEVARHPLPRREDPQTPPPMIKYRHC